MQPRMKNPVMIFPKALQSLLALKSTLEGSGLPESTAKLVLLRVSQINGCSLCVDMHAREMRQAGETDERLFAVAAWRDTPYFTDAERAALALAECVTRLSDRPDPVPDDVWDEAARHHDEKSLAALLLTIALINVFNRVNVPTRQVAGDWTKNAEAREWMEKNVFAQTA